jgi:hypothetical protein
MSLTSGLKVVGNHVFFFPEGVSYTIPGAGTCARESKPGSGDAGWVNCGIIDTAKIKKNSEVVEQFAPLPGARRLYDKVDTKRGLRITFTTKDVTPLAVEHLLGTLNLGSASTQYNPLEGVTKRGWLKIQQYDQSDTLINTVDVYVYLTIERDTEFGEKEVEIEYSADVLHSTLNTGTL